MNNIKIETLDNVITTIKNNISNYKSSFESEYSEYSLPEIALYKKGYHDIFNLYDYPAIITSFDNRVNTNTSSFSELTVDLVLIVQWNDAEELNFIGMGYSDVLYNLLNDKYTLEDNVLNTKISKENHFGGTEHYIIDYTLVIEREV